MKNTETSLSLATLSQWGKRYLVILSLFLIPTLGVLVQALSQHLSISSLMMRAWQGFGWFKLGDNGSLGRVILTVVLYGLIEYCAILFFKAMRTIENLPVGDESESQARFQSILRWTLLFSVILILVIPFHSRDMYAYINYGAEQVFYGKNPYTFPVSALAGWHHNPMFHPNWVNYPSNYGFAFILLTRLLVALSGGHFFITFLLFKMVNMATHIAITALIYQISKSLHHEKPELNAFLYGWNPLILLHFLANGHNDLLMTLPILASFWLLFSVKRFQALVIPLWALGILMKYAALVAAPFLLLFLIQTGQFHSLWAGLAMSIGLFTLLYLPFRDFGLQTMQAHPAWYEIKTQHSWQAMVLAFYRLLEKSAHSLKSFRYAFQTGMSNVAWAGYLGYWGFYLVRAFKNFKDPVQLIRITALLIALLICLANRMFHPWYVGLFFPFVLLLPAEDKLRRFGLLLTFTQLISFTLLERTEIISFLPTLMTWAWVYFPRSQGKPKATNELISTH